MKIYSEITNKFYDTVEACEKAEKEIKAEKEKKEVEAKKLAVERKNAAEVVDDLFKTYMQARENFEDGLRNFCNKYGAYHKTVKADDIKDTSNLLKSLSELVDLFI